MKREPKLYVEDIKNCIKSIENYTQGITFEDFLKNKMAIDAVERNFITIRRSIKYDTQRISRKTS